MRKVLFWLGCAVLIALPIAFAAEIYIIQDLPVVQIWQWAVLGAAVLLVYVARDRDDVLKHRIA